MEWPCEFLYEIFLALKMGLIGPHGQWVRDYTLYSAVCSATGNEPPEPENYDPETYHLRILEDIDDLTQEEFDRRQLKVERKAFGAVLGGSK